MLSSQPSAPARERIGRYQVLRKIATGGMAELFLARQVGLDGFEKVVAIKRILAHLAHDQEFVQMFQDEARIVAKLHHPNIVQIYDLGKSDDTYFIAMEYIAGRNLSSVAKKARAKGVALPPTHIAQCISQACEGLYYAHTRHDINGKPLQIVHRDVSPQNIIVSFSGAVKLVDFGIAKAATKIAHTRAGVLKGKYAYMSPEQIRGQATDCRSDLFAVGIVLYELLCGQRPFEKENSIQTLKSIVQDEAVSCQQLNPAIPDPLAQIIERCLSKTPDERFQTAQEIQLALEDFVSTSPQRINNLVIGQWITELFEEDLAKNHGAKMNLPGLGDIVLPEQQPPPRAASMEQTEPPDDPSPVPNLMLKQGRGGGSISLQSPLVNMPAEASPPPPSTPNNDIDDEGRANLIEEGIIERAEPSRSTGAMRWDQASTVYLSGAETATQPREAAASSGPRTARDRPLHIEEDDAETIHPDALASSPDEDAPSMKGEAALLDSGGFMEPLGGEFSFESQSEDPWDEATVGLPNGFEAADEPEPEGIAVGQAKRTGVPRRRSIVQQNSSLLSGPTDMADVAQSDSLDRASDPQLQEGEIRAAAEAAAELVDNEGWQPFDDDNDGPTAGLDDPWGDKTAADPGLFPEEDDAAFVKAFDDDDDPEARFDKTIAQAVLHEDGTVDATIDRTVDRTIDQRFGSDGGDSTLDQAAVISGPRTAGDVAPLVSASVSLDDDIPASLAEVTIAGGRLTTDDDEFNDDRTVAYNEEFSSHRIAAFKPNGAASASSPDRTIVAPAAGEALTDAVVEGDDLPLLTGMSDQSTIRSLSDEDFVPVLPQTSSFDDGRTIAGVMSPEASDSFNFGDRSGLDASDPPTHGLPPMRDDGRVPVGRIALSSPTEDAHSRRDFAPEEDATVGALQRGSDRGPRIPSLDSAAHAMELDRLAEPVQPSPLEAPPGEDDQASFQDEYSALVARPAPLNAPKEAPPSEPMGIGSTNVPPASLSLSQMLAHPAQTPRSKMSATPRVSTVGSAAHRTAALRSASMVGRQIREVVRSSEPPVVVAAPKLPTPEPRLDLHAVLEQPSEEPDFTVTPAPPSRVWLAPVLAALSAVLLGVAVYLALPYLFGPAEPHLTIKTTPVGAQVLVDGALQRGVTPITISGLKPGVTYRIRLEREGYDTVDRQVQLPKDGPLIWQIPLRPTASVQK